MAEDFKSCSVDGCKNNAHWRLQGRKGMCNAHYKRWSKYGDPSEGGTPLGEPMKWLLEVAAVFTGDNCLVWPYARSGAGYAQVHEAGIKKQAARILCEMEHGAPSSPDHEAAHSCGRGAEGCINPRHLRWATRLENEEDKRLHGTVARGEHQGMSKLTEADVRAIRELARTLPQREVARRFGVRQENVSSIVRRASWAWLT